jgi:hypothetical protein
VADLNSLPEQFSSLVKKPIKLTTENENSIDKIIVIDAIDECFTLWIVESLIRTILDGVADIPLKFFITSRTEDWIKATFRRNVASGLKIFILHDVAKQDVQSDIQRYLEWTLSEIANSRGYSGDDWPPEEEVRILLTRSDGLFIYAATAVRYVGYRDANPRKRLSKLTGSGLSFPFLDSFYKLIVDEAFQNHLDDEEKSSRHKVLAAVVFLQTPQSIPGIASLLDMPYDQVEADLSRFHSVVHVPSSHNGHVSIFHASFPSSS